MRAMALLAETPVAIGVLGRDAEHVVPGRLGEHTIERVFRAGNDEEERPATPGGLSRPAGENIDTGWPSDRRQNIPVTAHVPGLAF